MLVINEEYAKNLNDKYSTKNICGSKNDDYKQNLGTSFELEVNRDLMELPEFVLYWDIPVIVNSPIKWTLQGDFWNNAKPALEKPERNVFQIDHVLITPSVVFIFESKCYPGEVYAPKGDRWYYGSDKDPKSLPNPFSQLNLYRAVFEQILCYYNVSLPICDTVIFKYGVHLQPPGINDNMVISKELKYFIMRKIQSYPRKRLEALKLIQSLYFDGCSPIAYDGNTSGWQK